MHARTPLFRNSLKHEFSICLFELFSKEYLQVEMLSEPGRIKDSLDEIGKKYLKLITAKSAQTESKYSQYFTKAPFLRTILSA